MKWSLISAAFIAASNLAVSAALAQTPVQPLVNTGSGVTGFTEETLDALAASKTNKRSPAMEYRKSVVDPSPKDTGPKMNDEIAKEKMKNQMLDVLESSKMEMLKQANGVSKDSMQKLAPAEKK